MKTKWIRELFSFSGKERSGIVILLLIIFLLIGVGKVIPLFIRDKQTDFSKWEAEVNAYLHQTGDSKNGALTLHPENFDPNSVDSITLVKMGLPLKVVANWMRYLNKGGRFRDKEGIRRIYGMSSEIFEQLDSFIVFPRKIAPVVKGTAINPGLLPSANSPKNTGLREKAAVKGSAEIKIIELNTADSLQLVEIRGIGAKLASRIIRFRNLLGGFYSISQLKEVYGMSRENFEAIAPFLTVDPSAIKPFNINFSTRQELGHHPYIGYRTAGMVIKLRDKMGKFISAGDLTPIITADSLNRLMPYLKFAQ